jgi:pimeloyl-ACP methyl ester carboxylesterase
MLCEFEVHGTKVVALRSSPAAPRLLLVHGAGGNHNSFHELLEHLGVESSGCSLPGRCGSEGPALASGAEVALWLADFIRAAKLGPIAIGGHSFGGAVAIELALLQEEDSTLDLRGLLLLATGARLRVHPQILQMMEKAAEKGQAASLRHTAFSKGTNAEVIKRHDEYANQTPAAAALIDWRAADQFDRMAELGRIELPTLVLSAEDDSLTPPKYASYLHAHLKSSTHVELSGSGHMFPIEKAEECAEQMRQFITPLFSNEDS